ncbi:MAG: BtpA/SgcQ family protein [Candidatus Obscuribacterales bacterium]|nr:BtpA/SgcQ family protein [Candidatus Obscuribacterales bacterium]
MLLEEIFSTKKPVIGVIHLLALPGSARFDGQLDMTLARAEQEAAALASGGVDGIIIENFFDTPFTKSRVDTATACAMTLAAQKVKAISALPLGINVLRNDAKTALAVASVVGAQFIRVNVLTGAMLCDQGIIEGEAHDLMLYRRQLGMDRKIAVFADVMVKHAVPLGQWSDIKQQALDTVKRAMADAIIVSGKATGNAPDLEDIKAVRQVLPETPILVGSGSSKENAAQMLAYADGIIVASTLKRQGILENPIDVERTRSLVDAVKSKRN